MDTAGMAKADTSIAPKPGSSFLDIAADWVKAIPYVGPLVHGLIKDKKWGALGVALLLGWQFFLYPLLLPVLAAAWINAGVLQEIREPYSEKVRQAFGAQEFANRVARESNKRLDYVQVLEYDVDASQSQIHLLSVAANQKIVYRVEEAKLHSEDKSCEVPKSLGSTPNITLFLLLFEGLEVGQVRNGPHEDHELTAAQWKAIVDKVGENVDRLYVEVKPVPVLSNLRCGKVKIRMKILFKVFKTAVG